MYKCRSIETLLQKSFRLCSNYENIQRKIKTLKPIFKQKNYPQNFVNKLLNKLFIQNDFNFAIPKTKLTPKTLGVFFPPQSNLSWKFHWNSSRVSEDMKTFSVNIAYFHRLSSVFWIVWHFLITNNRWCRHFSTFNMRKRFSVE